MDERFQIVEITFKPEVKVDENNTVSIMGEFNNWIPEIMERYESERVLLEPELANTFFYRTKLFVGFKYRYHFSVGDEFVVDQTKEFSKDRLGKETNFVVVQANKINSQQSNEEMKEEEKKDLDDVIDGLENEGDSADKSDNKAVDKAAAQSLLLNNFPSYVNQEMGKLLPKDILKKQGVRVID